jgi:hypothetical protein
MSARLVERIKTAINAHDLESLASCFEDGYPSENPLHPERSFRGREQMRANWAQIFAAVPDMAATVIRVVADGPTSAAEWEWAGRRTDGTSLFFRGVTLQSGYEQAAWVRLYMEAVDLSGVGVDEAIEQAVGTGR